MESVEEEDSLVPLSSIAKSATLHDALFFFRSPLFLEGSSEFSSLVEMDIDAVIITSSVMFLAWACANRSDRPFFSLAPDLTNMNFIHDALISCEVLAIPKIGHRRANAKEVSISVAAINGIPLYVILGFERCSTAERLDTCEKLKNLFCDGRYLRMLREQVGNVLREFGFYEQAKLEHLVDGHSIIRPVKMLCKCWIRG